MVITTVTVIKAVTAVTVLMAAMAVMVIMGAMVKRRAPVNQNLRAKAVVISMRKILKIRIDTFIYRIRKGKGMEVKTTISFFSFVPRAGLLPILPVTVAPYFSFL